MLRHLQRDESQSSSDNRQQRCRAVARISRRADPKADEPGRHTNPERREPLDCSIPGE